MSDRPRAASGYAPAEDWRSRRVLSVVAALALGAGIGVLGWSLWWPHSDRGLPGLAAVIAILGLAVLLRNREMVGLAVASSLVIGSAVATYWLTVTLTIDRCGHCPPWHNEAPPSITVPTGPPVPPLVDATS